jgi:hypothetical protein
MTSIARTWEVDVVTCAHDDVGRDEELTWKVWVELPSGAYRVWGTFTGTEAQAISTALAEAGAPRAFALPEVGSGSHSKEPRRRREPSRGAATGRYP